MTKETGNKYRHTHTHNVNKTKNHKINKMKSRIYNFLKVLWNRWNYRDDLIYTILRTLSMSVIHQLRITRAMKLNRLCNGLMFLKDSLNNQGNNEKKNAAIETFELCLKCADNYFI